MKEHQDTTTAYNAGYTDCARAIHTRLCASIQIEPLTDAKIVLQTLADKVYPLTLWPGS